MGAETAARRALSVYRRYLGEPEREIDVYAGFALFFGGIALGVIGLLIFLWSVTLPETEAFFWQLREIAIVLGAVGLPAILLSVVVLLPVSRRAVAMAGVGSAVCLAGIAVFVWAYPNNWNVTRAADYSAEGVAVYAGGLAVLVAATGSALVAHHIERAAPAETASAEADTSGSTGGSASNGSGGETITDEQVSQDVEEALSTTDLSWGGVEQDRNTKRLKIQTPDVDTSAAEGDAPDLDESTANTARSEGVDDAVDGLRRLQGEGPKEESSDEGIDEQTAALRELRERRELEAEEDETIADRFKRFLKSQ